MIDTHAHIDTEAFDENRTEILEEGFSEGLEAVIIPAIEPKDFRRVLHAVSLSDKIFGAMGVHPHNASEVNSEVLGFIEKTVAENDSFVAVGEIGLDYYYDFNPPSIQKNAFENQIAVAKNLDYPMIIHNRESDDDLLSIIKENQDGNLKGVLHCFSGDEEMLERALDLGMMVSFTGNITFKKSTLAPVIEKVPFERVMIETDSPYMTPAPFRGKQNKPSYVKYVAGKIAEIKSISIEEVIEMTTKNAKKFFNLTLLLAMMTIFSFNAFAQIPPEEYFDEEENVEEEQYYNPYAKKIGGGFILGTNTIVQTYNPGEEERSQEGISAYGGGVNYYLNDYFSLSGSYFYSKNSKLAEKNPDFGLGANHHHMAQLSLYVYSTPWKMINLFAMVGPSYSFNKISTGYDIKNESTIYETAGDMGINTGVGFLFNFDAGAAGIFTLSAEWKVDFILGAQEFDTDFRYDPIKESEKYNSAMEVSNFYSVPQFKIYWYPKFFQ